MTNKDLKHLLGSFGLSFTRRSLVANAMRNNKSISILFSALALFGFFVSQPTMLDSAEATTGPYLTDTEPYITMANSTNGSVKAIITSGDRVGDSDYEFAKIPDGIGAFITSQTPNSTDQTLAYSLATNY
jgi:hypothetical protein